MPYPWMHPSECQRVCCIDEEGNRYTKEEQQRAWDRLEKAANKKETKNGNDVR